MQSIAVTPSLISELPSTVSSSTCQSIVGTGLPSKELSNTHIVYQGYNDKGSPLLWVVSMADGERTLLRDYPGAVSRLGFLKDGQHFLIAIGDGGHAWLGNIDGSPAIKVNLTEELLSNFQPHSPLWSELIGLPPDIVDYRNGHFHSPDGQTIASWELGDSALTLFNTSTQITTEVVPTGKQDSITGRWTIDGKWFIFAYMHGNSTSYYSEILEVNPGGTELRPLTIRFDHRAFVSPIISPDSQKIIFVDEEWPESLGVLWLETGKLRFYPLDQSIASSYGDSTVWAPNSSWVAFLSEGEQVDIRVINIDTGKIYCITQDSIRENLMDWR
jgi:hypothetical protein